jgi:alpha-glucosidase
MAQDAPVRRVLLRTCPDGEQMFVELHPEGEPQPGSPCRWWQARLKLTMPQTRYRFLIFAEDGAWWFNGGGIHAGLVTDAQDFCILAGYQAPEWVRSSVFYQIFPDRFANGDPANDVQDGEFSYWGWRSRRKAWGEPVSQGPDAMAEFYGGDLPGILQHLDEIAELGANALYLTPVFTAQSNHRYDVMDYENVDVHLGGNAALSALRQALDSRHMQMILDIVPNHCGVLHPWFQAALADPHAPSASFFSFRQHPQEYECWLGVRGLPKLNYRSSALRQLMYGDENAIFRRWLKPPYGLDGWRIDVANMLARHGADQLGIEVGRGIRRAVKETNPQAYLLGENFFDGTEQLQGDLWDATMNYSGFSKPVRFWLRGFEIGQFAEPHHVASETPWTGQAVAQSWQAFRAAIPWVIARQQYNLLGSHDTSRFLTQVGGDAVHNRLAVTLLFTYPGVPSIFYGDEIGLQGEGGTGARQCMPWNRELWDLDLRSQYRALIRLRRSSPALIDGGFQMLLAEADTLAFLRDAEDQQIVVVAQRGPARRAAAPIPVAHGGLPDGLVLRELFSGRQVSVAGGCLDLGALEPGAQVWVSSS